jgi:hypothetical protein
MSLEESMNWKGVFEGRKQKIQIQSAELANKEQHLIKRCMIYLV